MKVEAQNEKQPKKMKNFKKRKNTRLQIQFLHKIPNLKINMRI